MREITADGDFITSLDNPVSENIISSFGVECLTQIKSSKLCPPMNMMQSGDSTFQMSIIIGSIEREVKGQFFPHVIAVSLFSANTCYSHARRPNSARNCPIIARCLCRMPGCWPVDKASLQCLVYSAISRQISLNCLQLQNGIMGNRSRASDGHS